MLVQSFKKWARVMMAPALMVLAVGSTVPDVAQAQQRQPTRNQPTKAPVPNRVGVEVMVVHATQKETKVDPRLKNIMRQLRFTNFKGFKLLQEQDTVLTDGNDTTISIAGGRKLKVRLLSHNASQAKLQIRMMKDGSKILDTTVSIKRGMAFLIGGPNFQGGKLILPITVDY